MFSFVNKRYSVPVYDGRSGFTKRQLFNELPAISLSDIESNSVVLITFTVAKYLAPSVRDYVKSHCIGLSLNVQNVVLLADTNDPDKRLTSVHTSGTIPGVDNNTHPSINILRQLLIDEDDKRLAKEMITTESKKKVSDEELDEQL